MNIIDKDLSHSLTKEWLNFIEDFFDEMPEDSKGKAITANTLLFMSFISYLMKKNYNNSES